MRPAPLRPRAPGNCVRMGRVFSPEGPLTQRHSRVRSGQRGSGRSLPRAESSVSLKPSLPVCWASVSAHCTIGNRAPAGPPAPRVCCCGWRHTIRKQSLRRRLDEFGPTGELWIRRIWISRLRCRYETQRRVEQVYESNSGGVEVCMYSEFRDPFIIHPSSFPQMLARADWIFFSKLAMGCSPCASAGLLMAGAAGVETC